MINNPLDLTLVHDSDYRVYSSKFITDNATEMLSDVEHYAKKFSVNHNEFYIRRTLRNRGGIENHSNVRNLILLPKWQLFYNGIADIIRQMYMDKVPTPPSEVYVKGWFNLFTSDRIMATHHHYGDFHLVVCLTTNPTITNYTEYNIPTETGTIYIGPSSHAHSVENLSDYDGIRMTMAFNVLSDLKEVPTPHDYSPVLLT